MEQINKYEEWYFQSEKQVSEIFQQTKSVQQWIKQQ